MVSRPADVDNDQIEVKMKNVAFILWKKSYGLFGQPKASGTWKMFI